MILAVWWGDGSVGPAREGLVALSRGSSAVIWNQDGDQVFYDKTPLSECKKDL